MKKNIKKAAITLAAIEALTLNSCNIKNTSKSIEQESNHEATIEFVDDRIYGTNYIYDRHINIYTDMFENKNEDVLAYSPAALYDLNGNYLRECDSYTHAKVLKEDKYSGLYLLKLENGEEVIAKKFQFDYYPQLNNTVFYDITDDNDKIVTNYTLLYDENGYHICGAYEGYECKALKTNGEYTLVEMKTNNFDKITGYIRNNDLISRFNSVNFYANASRDTTAYIEKELIHPANYYNAPEGKLLDVLFITDDYACISIEDGTNCVYMDAKDINVIEKIETTSPSPEPAPAPVYDPWYEINAYYYLTKDAFLFKDESFDNPGTLIDAYQKIYVIKYDGTWSYVRTENGEYGFMEPYLLNKLPEDVFVDVDISEQTTRLYYNYEEVFSTPNVTGKDKTPTDIGYFDIDSKTKDTYLTSYYPNGQLEYSTHVDYWMPYNGGEGLHDAPWQNGHFGEPDYYHWGGSHGCVNMPLESAAIIYENVDVGTKVLVHK